MFLKKCFKIVTFNLSGNHVAKISIQIRINEQQFFFNRIGVCGQLPMFLTIQFRATFSSFIVQANVMFFKL